MGTGEAFATLKELREVHGPKFATGIVEDCRAEMIDVARVIEEWALRYEVASLEHASRKYPDYGALLKAKADCIRCDMPRIIKQVLSGRDIPPRDLLLQLRELLEDE
jgi:hypothetical protein